jgi:antitoxin YefM
MVFSLMWDTLKLDFRQQCCPLAVEYRLLILWNFTMQQDSFNHVKTHFSEICHRVIEDHDVLLVTRENAENVVIMPQSLFDSWQETIYLLKSPANAAMLAKSIAEHQSGQTIERELIDATSGRSVSYRAS